MKIQIISSLGMRYATITLLVAQIGYLANRATAQDVTLNSGGTSASFNLGGGTGAIGMNNWRLDTDLGQSMLDQQWFWYSINTGSGWSQAQSIDQIGGLAATNSGSTLTATYENSTMEVTLQYELIGSGAGSGGAVLNESVDVLNLSSSSFEINFWQYGHFKLPIGGNYVNIGGSPGAYSFVSQSTIADPGEETLNEQYANYAETGNPTTVLSDVANGNQLNDVFSAGPGDEAWGFEWAGTDSPGGSWSILQGENLSVTVPEPGTICLVGLGLGTMGMARRSLKRKV